MARKATNIFAPRDRHAAVRDSFPKLDPRSQVKNPVMFIVEIGSVITTVIFFLDIARGNDVPALVRRRRSRSGSG